MNIIDQLLQEEQDGELSRDTLNAFYQQTPALSEKQISFGRAIINRNSSPEPVDEHRERLASVVAASKRTAKLAAGTPVRFLDGTEGVVLGSGKKGGYYTARKGEHTVQVPRAAVTAI